MLEEIVIGTVTMVYIGRSGRSYRGLFGNPVAIGATCPLCKLKHADASSTLRCYKRLLWTRMQADAAFRQAVSELRGRKLWCPGCGPDSATCHGRILERAASWAAEQG